MPDIHRRWRGLLAVAVLFLAAPLPTSAQGTPPVSLAGLLLPHRLFPSSARLSQVSRPSSQLRGSASSGIVSLADLAQRAGWQLGRPRRGFISLRLMASLYASPSDAAEVQADASSAGWLAGRPCAFGALRRSTLCVTERDGHIDVLLVMRHGPVELELTLRATSRTPVHEVALATNRLVGIRTYLERRSAALVKSLPPASPSVSGTLPPIFAAPLGTGPIVESPSLLAGSSGNSIAAQSWLERRSRRDLPLRPPTALSSYQASCGSSCAVAYHSVSLYRDPAAAGAALRQLAALNRHYAVAAGLPPAGVDNQVIWRTPTEVAEALTVQNAMLIFVCRGSDLSCPQDAVPSALSRLPSWLHAQGNQIVRADGTPVQLNALSWYGAEESDFVVGGLEYQPYQSILQDIRRLGYNAIRLPFSNQLVEQNPIVTQHLAQNPELKGMHALDILDRIINYAGALGLGVILDNHRSEAGWSAEPNGLWYDAAYPTNSFVHDWATLAARYASSDVVIGADLRNEPHGQATWGDGNPSTDWRLAAEQAGDAALAANPHLLIMVEGVQTYQGDKFWWGANLLGVAVAPVSLTFADGSSAQSQLVYSAHDYGPDTCQQGCPWLHDATAQSLDAAWEQHWGYIADTPGAAYTAPVFVGEFGTCTTSPTCGSDTAAGSQGLWFSALTTYVQQHQLSWG
ncbi:MAG: glycoside hydrolase family 5 protein, partial [Chloroflexota bacterium]